MHDAPAQQCGPEAVHQSAGQQRIVIRRGIGQRFAAGEFGHAHLGFGIHVFVIAIRFLLVAGGPGFRHGVSGQEGDGGGLRFLVQVREIDEAPDSGLTHAAGAFHVFAAVEGGDEAPVVALFDLAGQRVVVALGAIDLRAVNEGSDGFGDLLVFVAAFVEEPRRAFGFRLVFRAGRQQIAHGFIPWTVVPEIVFKKVPPAVFAATVLVAVPLAASHQEGIPQLAHPYRIVVGSQQTVHEGRAARVGRGLMEFSQFGGRGDAPGEIQGDAPRPGGVVHGVGRSQSPLGPAFGQEGVHGQGH